MTLAVARVVGAIKIVRQIPGSGFQGFSFRLAYAFFTGGFLHLLEDLPGGSVSVLELVTALFQPLLALHHPREHGLGRLGQVFAEMPEVQHLRGGVLFEPRSKIARPIADAHIAGMLVALFHPRDLPIHAFEEGSFPVFGGRRHIRRVQALSCRVVEGNGPDHGLAVAVVTEQHARAVQSEGNARHVHRKRFVADAVPQVRLCFDACGYQRGNVLDIAARYLAVQGLGQILLHSPGIVVAVLRGYQLGEARRGVTDDTGVVFERDVGLAAGRTLVGVACNFDGTEGAFVFFLHWLLLGGVFGVADDDGRAVGVELCEALCGEFASGIVERVLHLLFEVQEIGTHRNSHFDDQFVVFFADGLGAHYLMRHSTRKVQIIVYSVNYDNYIRLRSHPLELAHEAPNFDMELWLKSDASMADGVVRDRKEGTVQIEGGAMQGFFSGFWYRVTKPVGNKRNVLWYQKSSWARRPIIAKSRQHIFVSVFPNEDLWLPRAFIDWLRLDSPYFGSTPFPTNQAEIDPFNQEMVNLMKNYGSGFLKEKIANKEFYEAENSTLDVTDLAHSKNWPKIRSKERLLDYIIKVLSHNPIRSSGIRIVCWDILSDPRFLKMSKNQKLEIGRLAVKACESGSPLERKLAALYLILYKEFELEADWVMENLGIFDETRIETALLLVKHGFRETACQFVAQNDKANFSIQLAFNELNFLAELLKSGTDPPEKK